MSGALRPGRASVAAAVAVAILSAACDSGPAVPRPSDSAPVEATPSGEGPYERTSRSDRNEHKAASKFTPKPGSPAASACALPPAYLTRIRRGYDPARSGEIMIVPKYPNFISGGISHAGPWEYLQHVPLFLYGPGHIRPRGKVNRPVTSADIAPTIAKLIGFRNASWDPDGTPLREALVRDAEDPPRLVVVVVWDAGGRIVLRTWPRSWPNLRGLIPKGTWYDKAFVGSSPSVTGPIHATIGTGVYPARHGVVDDLLRFEGRVQEAYKDLGPGVMRSGTLADMYDRARHNKPKVGVVATHDWHLAMAGHGSFLPRADRDIAAIKLPGAKLPDWRPSAAMRPYFTYPKYVEEVGGLEEAAQKIDVADGRDDGYWRDVSIADQELGFDTPARVEYQTRIIERIMKEEGFGADWIPDLLFVNHKFIDYVEHIWTLNSPQMSDTVKWTDRGLPLMTRILNRLVGKGEWVMMLTADHGATPDPDVSGGFPIKISKLEADLRREFDDTTDDRAVVQKIRPTHIWFSVKEIEENGFRLDQVARYLLAYTKSENHDGAGDGKVFQAAFPSKVLDLIDC